MLLTVAAIALALAPRPALGQKSCELGTIPQRDRTSGPREEASASLSSDGRFLAFASRVRLSPVETKGISNIYVLDRSSGEVTLESLMPNGRASTGDSLRPRLSGDGRFVVFDSLAPLAAGRPLGGGSQVLLRDRQLGTTKVLSINRAGELGNGYSDHAVISANGRVVAFKSSATNLLPDPDANGVATDVYLVDVVTSEIVRASVDSAGNQPLEGASVSPGLSADGRVVVFTSKAPLDRSDLTATSWTQPTQRPPTPRYDGVAHVFVRDLERRTTRRVSHRVDGGEPNGHSYLPTISGDGRYIAFVSEATDLVSRDKNHAPDIYLYDRETSTTTLVSRSAAGGTPNGGSTNPAISGSGRFIAFQSEASDLVCTRRCTPASRDINLVWDVFLLDRATGMTTRVSADPETGWMEPSGAPALDATGDVLAFSSRRPVNEQDRGNDFDLFVWTACAADDRAPRSH
jgi:Tol biopolymer transport system component